MARTVHHVPPQHRDGDCDNHACAYDYGGSPYWYWRNRCDYTGPQHVLHDLRYSALDLVRAQRTGTRPTPRRVRVTMTTHLSWARRYGCGHIGEYADQFEGRARMRTRMDLTDARRTVNAALRAGAEDGYDAAADLDLAPIRHRGSALWEAW